nr:hypothetical protein [Streptomyces sp. ISL-99]
MAWRDFWGRRGAVRVSALVLGAVWWCAALRLVLMPERTGVVEGAVAAGGWGLSLLPVHVVSEAAAGVGSGRRRRRGRTPGGEGGAGARLAGALWRGAGGAWRWGARRRGAGRRGA